MWEECKGGKEVTNALTRRQGNDETPTITPSVTTPKKTSDVVTAPRRGAYNKECFLIYNMGKKGAGVGCFLRRGVIE